MTADAVDTGAVVITGEALNKENAQPIAELFARQAGSFICASAGPNHEALLAAHGCGAVAALAHDVQHGAERRRRRWHVQTVADPPGRGRSDRGDQLGARLLAFDADGRVERVEAPRAACCAS